MTKPRLPVVIEVIFPVEVIRRLYSFVPHFPKPSPPISGLQRALERIQKSPKRNSMDLYGLEDFVLC